MRATRTKRTRRNPFIDPCKEMPYEHQLVSSDSEDDAIGLVLALHASDIDVFEAVAALEEQLGRPLNPPKS